MYSALKKLSALCIVLAILSGIHAVFAAVFLREVLHSWAGGYTALLALAYVYAPVILICLAVALKKIAAELESDAMTKRQRLKGLEERLSKLEKAAN